MNTILIDNENEKDNKWTNEYQWIPNEYQMNIISKSNGWYQIRIHYLSTKKTKQSILSIGLYIKKNS